MSSILVIIPIRPGLHPEILRRSMACAMAMMGANPVHELSYLLDNRLEAKLPDERLAWANVARIRNRILDAINLDTYDYLLWIDADMTEFPPDMPSKLIAANPEGMTAPMVFIEGTKNFYDTAGFVDLDGNHFNQGGTYWCTGQPRDEIAEVAGVGAITMVNAKHYRPAGSVRYDPTEPQNTDHWPIARRVREHGCKVMVHRGIAAYHAALNQYKGEDWH
jgi:hypothetical protein